MDQCQIDGFDEHKIPHEIHHETIIKSVKHISIRKNTAESDHRTSKRKNDISNLNTLKKKKKYETALAAIFPENDQSYLQYAQDYAEGYMKKLKEKLNTESFDIAIKLLASFSDADDSNINVLYQQISDIFTRKNEDLIYEFLGFLLPGQALSIGKFTDYLELTRIKEFIRKLQVCMKKQPTQVRKILDNLFHLSKNEYITSSEVHTVMLPLLKSNPILVDCFFQLIPTEHPPESFFSDDNWEDLDIDQSINCGIDYEEIILSDSEDHTLLNICHCTCHKSGNNLHCRSCGLKFFKGRVYFDTSEGLKLAKINFEGVDPSIVHSKIDKTEENVTVKQKNRKSLIKNHSPGSAEDIKGSTGTESEEDLIDVKPKKRQKSKVVQSLKLKFKKEDVLKCKEDQETHNETGKSIVHVTNDELNSSEMVFFCIPKTESNVKTSPKKKLKTDVKESLVQKEYENIDQHNLNNSDASNKINADNPLVTYTVKNKHIEINTKPKTVSINNSLEINNKYETPIKLEVELINQSLAVNNLANDCNESNNINLLRLDECKNIIKKEFDQDSNTDTSNKKQCDNDFSTNLTNDNCYSFSNTNKPMLEQNIKIESETTENLPKCSSKKQDNDESVKHLINKWTIDEDKIILQTCKRVEDIEVLLETINRRIPQRSVSEIQERFTTLMTLLEQMIDVKHN